MQCGAGWGGPRCLVWWGGGGRELGVFWLVASGGRFLEPWQQHTHRYVQCAA